MCGWTNDISAYGTIKRAESLMMFSAEVTSGSVP